MNKWPSILCAAHCALMPVLSMFVGATMLHHPIVEVAEHMLIAVVFLCAYANGVQARPCRTGSSCGGCIAHREPSSSFAVLFAWLRECLHDVHCQLSNLRRSKDVSCAPHPLILFGTTVPPQHLAMSRCSSFIIITPPNKLTIFFSSITLLLMHPRTDLCSRTVPSFKINLA